MTDEAISPLRRRMIEDMTIRKFAPKTQHDYVQRVKNFAAFLGRSPDTASFEDVRRYQLHLVASGVGVPTINQTVSTLLHGGGRSVWRVWRLPTNCGPSAIRRVSAFRRGGWNTIHLGLRRSTSRPVRSRSEIIRRLDIGCAKGV